MLNRLKFMDVVKLANYSLGRINWRLSHEDIKFEDRSSELVSISQVFIMCI